MSFTSRYLTWLLGPPLVVSIPPALLFLAQVVQLSTERMLGLLGLLALTYIGGSVLFAYGVRRHAHRVQDALAGEGDLSEAMSACLERTTTLLRFEMNGPGLVGCV